MTPTFTIQTLPWFDRLLWAASHSLWQGAIAAAIVWACGQFIGSARTKHMLSWTALLCVLAMFVANIFLAPRVVLEVGTEDRAGWEFGAMGAAMWVSAFVALVSLIGVRFFSLMRIIRRASPVSMELNQILIDAAAIATRSETRPNTVVCPQISTPAAAHNRVLLPPSCLHSLDSRELASVIAHENAHLHRGDFWLNVVQNILEAALIFNPFAWYLSARIRVDREHCCDDDAVAATGDVVAYGRALAKLAVGRELQPALAVAMADAKVSHRIRRLASPKRANRGGAWMPLVTVAGSLLAFSLFAASQPRHQLFNVPDKNQSVTIKVVKFRDGERAQWTSQSDSFVSAYVTSSSSSSSSTSSSSSSY